MFSIFFLFFKQKTAYEMRISDWSSDVCSSDLVEGHSGAPPCAGQLLRPPLRRRTRSRDRGRGDDGVEGRAGEPRDRDHRAGRRGARAEPELSDPYFRLHHRGRDDPQRAHDPRRELLARSEEHTSELQSLMRISYAVFCWKKK